MNNNPLKELRTYGQSIWLDNIRRDLIASGGLQKLIDDDGIRGVTSNPSIFEKAIIGSDDYDHSLMLLRAEGKLIPEILEGLSIQDIQMAADVFKPVFDDSEGEDGFISLEVSPLLADKEEETVEAVLDLYKRVARENVMIKVPATAAGIRAHERLTAMAISTNMTLIFSLETYQAVAEAYIKGLKQLDDNRQPLGSVRSVASVFVSRIDTEADKAIAALLEVEKDPKKTDQLKSLAGKIAVSNAKMIYASFKTLFQDDAFAELKKLGAHVQRPLWASTGTKNPAYSDVLYIEELIGPHTVNTVPPATLDAFRDHGKIRSSIEEEVDAAALSLKTLSAVGIDLQKITTQLQDAGVEAFADSYRNLIAALTEKQEKLVDRHRMHFG